MSKLDTLLAALPFRLRAKSYLSDTESDIVHMEEGKLNRQQSDQFTIRANSTPKDLLSGDPNGSGVETDV